jgi:hypothetical protein
VSRLTFGRDKQVASNLVFFDAAGEDLTSLDVLEREARYVTLSDGLIMLVDPLQVPAIREELEGEVELPAETADPHAILARLAALIRESRGIPGDKRIDVPVAISVSKIDALRPLLGEDHVVFSAPVQEGSYQASAARNISQALRSDLASLIGQQFDNLVQQEFESASYFGLSSLGEAPVNGSIQRGVSPHRVEDPILWMLNEWGALA